MWYRRSLVPSTTTTIRRGQTTESPRTPQMCWPTSTTSTNSKSSSRSWSCLQDQSWCTAGVCVCVCACVCSVYALSVACLYCVQVVMYVGVFSMPVPANSKLFVHCTCFLCSAGIGRTGTFIIVDLLLNKIAREGAYNIGYACTMFVHACMFTYKYVCATGSVNQCSCSQPSGNTKQQT